MVPKHLSVLSSKATSGFFCSLLLLYLRLQFCGPGAQTSVVFYTPILPLFLNTHHEASRTKHWCKNHKIFQTLHVLDFFVFFLSLFLPTSPSCVSHIFAVFLRCWGSVSNKKHHTCSYKTGNIFPFWEKSYEMLCPDRMLREWFFLFLHIRLFCKYTVSWRMCLGHMF